MAFLIFVVVLSRLWPEVEMYGIISVVVPILVIAILLLAVTLKLNESASSSCDECDESREHGRRGMARRHELPEARMHNDGV